jgi:ATP-dependent helicase Lhr and Lhr-like helicase
VVAEAWPDPRDADELHDALVTAGVFTGVEAAADPRWHVWLESLAQARRATWVRTAPSGEPLWIAAERLAELIAAFPALDMRPPIVVPPGRAAAAWTRETALVELLRGRTAILGPSTAAAFGRPFGLTADEADHALLALESDGVVLRGAFTARPDGVEWCDRRLLARIHRLTLNRLRAEIEPVTPADFMRFLFAWQHVTPERRVTGPDGLRAVLEQLDGYELAAGAWERHVLPARVQGYLASTLDGLCFAGAVAWGRLSNGSASSRPGSASRPVRSTPVALCLREHLDTWRTIAATGDTSAAGDAAWSVDATRILDRLRQRGASFVPELMSALSLTADDAQRALSELVAAGAVTSDGFAGLRAMFVRRQDAVVRTGGFVSRRTFVSAAAAGGRWSLVGQGDAGVSREAAVEHYARTLLTRYGIVFRRLLTRDVQGVSWREVVGVLRRLEARGEIRGGRFVHGMSGEQFALPDAIQLAREIRRTPASGAIVTISAADPLNLVGIVTGDDRVAAVAGTRIAWRDGVPLAALEGDYVRQLHDYEPEAARPVASALAGRPAPAVTSGFLGRRHARVAVQ